MNKNKPLTRAEMQALPVKAKVVLDKRGNESKRIYLPSYEPEYPTNKERRTERNRQPHHNGKQTRGRKYQTVDITVKEETKFGPVNVSTGWTRRIVNLVADNKITRAALKVRAAIMAKKMPLEPEKPVENKEAA